MAEHDTQRLIEIVGEAMQRPAPERGAYVRAACPDAGEQAEALSLLGARSEEHTSELQSLRHLVCRLLLEKKKNQPNTISSGSRPPTIAEPITATKHETHRRHATEGHAKLAYNCTRRSGSSIRRAPCIAPR